MGRCNNRAQVLSERSLARQILVFSLPLMASNLLQVLFHMADIAVVGHFSGSLALAAVGSTSMVVTLFTGVLMGIGGGFNALIARYYGAGDRKELRKTIHSAAILSVIIGMLMLLVGLVGSRFLLILLDTKQEVLDSAVLYMQIYFCGMPALAFYNFGHAVFSAAGDTRKPLYFLLFSGAVNVVLNLFFVIVLGMGVAGVALASILAQYLSGALILMALLRTNAVHGLRWQELHLHPKNSRELLALGVPTGLQNAIFYVASMFVQSGVNQFDTVMVAGNAAALNSDGLVYDLMAAFYTACSSFIGRSYGAGDHKQIWNSYLICMAYSVGMGAVLGFSLVALGSQFLALFTADPAVIQAGMKRLTVMGFSYCLSGIMDNALAASRGLGKSIIPTAFAVGGACVFRIVWVLTVFRWFGTIESLYLVYACSWILTGSLENWYFICCYRKVKSSFDKKSLRRIKWT